MIGAKQPPLWIFGVLLALPLGAQPWMRGGPWMRSGWMRVRMQAMHTLPAEYARMTNPLKPTPERIAEGGRLYQQYCASCHGPEGWGDGPAGESLQPAPTPLAHTMMMPMTTDGYAFWRIREGGQAFGSAMPAWKDVLTDEQIWAVILYMRAGFPPVDTVRSGSETPQEEKQESEP